MNESRRQVMTRWIRVAWTRRRRSYLFLTVPNLFLLLLNLYFLARPQVFDPIVPPLSASVSVPSPSLPKPEAPSTEVNSGQFTAGTTLEKLLRQKGLGAGLVRELFLAAKPFYDLGRVKAGRNYFLEHSMTSRELERFRYEIDEEKSLIVERSADGPWKARLHSRPVEKRVEPVNGVIQDNLFNAILQTGEKEILALQISDIFQWDVDFNTDLRVGDGYRLLVEKVFIEGKLIRYGRILAAEFSNQGRLYQGYLFKPPAGRTEYFNADGRPLRRELRKSPLQFMAPVSSRYSSSRYHPILKIYRPHLGVDYSAAEGMPVVAIADGRLSYMGWDSGGGGNMIRLDHSGGMASIYMHLARFASGFRQGQAVSQGDVIGYVGRTGLATGPHLDFRILKGGRYLNPAKVHGTPVDPLPASLMPQFTTARNQFRDQLAATPLPLLRAARR